MIFDPQAIEAELEAVQKENAPSAARASLLNIVAFSDETSQLEVEAILDHVLGKRAARVIRVVSSDEAESSISISARCKLDHNHESVCLQEIIVEDGRDGVGRAPTTWTALLVRDIPVYILWLRSITGERRLLEQVSQYADTIIIDTDDAARRGDPLAATIAGLHAVGLTDHSNGGTVISDLAWLRLKTLRQLVARMYDGSEAQPLLGQIAGVRLGGLSPVEALLFQGWLGERLGWTAVGNGWKDGRQRTLEMAVVAEKDMPRVEIRHYAGDTACVEIGGDNCAHLDVPGHRRETQSATLLGTPELFLHEIDAARQDILYAQALETLFPSRNQQN